MRFDKQYYVYFMANKTNVAIYIGLTSDLKRRVFEHKNKFVKGFTAKIPAGGAGPFPGR
jgi:putative endonuclease